ncbi:MAG: hypothetical protein M3290_03440 [Actinomycetota bacterium]|nr:hypothetical protein [Actinomycetota bacterium]
MKTKLAAIVVGFTLLSLLAGAVPASAKAKAGGPTTLGTDPAGDWGANVDSSVAPLGDALGQDLVGAQIGMKDSKTVNFIFELNSLPPNGGVPESSRYDWDFTANGTAFQLTGAWTDYLRGICNPLITDPTCPPPHDPGMQPFFLRQGDCLVGGQCSIVGTFQATFDPSAKTITVPVPLSAIKAKPGSVIGPGTTSLGGTIYAAPALLVSQGSLPNDTMAISTNYVIPGAKK